MSLTWRIYKIYSEIEEGQSAMDFIYFFPLYATNALINIDTNAQTELHWGLFMWWFINAHLGSAREDNASVLTQPSVQSCPLVWLAVSFSPLWGKRRKCTPWFFHWCVFSGHFPNLFIPACRHMGNVEGGDNTKELKVGSKRNSPWQIKWLGKCPERALILLCFSGVAVNFLLRSLFLY